MTIAIDPRDALIVVDLQNDFLPGGALAVANGNRVVPVINRMLELFPVKIFTRDWHPKDHISFSKHPEFADQSWPPHCVADTPGAQFAPELHVDRADRIVSKGIRREREAYSAFQDSDLTTWLKVRGIRRVTLAGLATDYCVKHTALDALAAGFEVRVARDACRGVNSPIGSESIALAEMEQAGIRIILSQELVCP